VEGGLVRGVEGGLVRCVEGGLVRDVVVLTTVSKLYISTG